MSGPGEAGEAWSAADGGVTVTAHDNGVMGLRFDRPGGNRLSWGAVRALTSAFDGAQTAAPRAWWLHTGGDDFSFGADLTDAALAEKMTTPAGRDEVERGGQRMLRAIQDSAAPVVVSAHGRVIGGGGGLFCACDFRFVSSDATIWFPEVERGMHLGWGIVPLLAREFGWPLARELALGGKPVPVRRLGAAVQVVPDDADPDQVAYDFACVLAAKPPLAVQSIKAGLREMAQTGGVDGESDVGRFLATTSSEDFAEAMAAFFDKRAGKYHGR